MNIHEYQAKELFAQYGIPVAHGAAVSAHDLIDETLDSMPTPLVVKAQIHAGGRGKGTFADGYQGGVKLAKTTRDASQIARHMLGNTLVTKQTGPAGRLVKTLYFTEAAEIDQEYYLAMLLDRQTFQPVIVASTEGGVDIEEVAESTPEKITTIPIDPLVGIKPWQGRRVAKALGFTGDLAKACLKLLDGLWRFYSERDVSLVEINPLITTKEGRLIALDAKVGFDDNALYRHPEIVALRDLNEEDEKEIEATKHDLSYIALDGTIACLVNGAGLAMATMDIIKHYGGEPANFLDVGGGANEDQVTAAFRIILSDSNVRGILVNIFGGIMKCDTIARGIIGAAQNVKITVPLVIRLEGTNVAEGKRLLEESGLPLTAAESLSQAAELIVEKAGAAPAS